MNLRPEFFPDDFSQTFQRDIYAQYYLPQNLGKSKKFLLIL